jgi:hypothetical protein
MEKEVLMTEVSISGTSSYRAAAEVDMVRYIHPDEVPPDIVGVGG